MEYCARTAACGALMIGSPWLFAHTARKLGDILYPSKETRKSMTETEKILLFASTSIGILAASFVTGQSILKIVIRLDPGLHLSTGAIPPDSHPVLATVGATFIKYYFPASMSLLAGTGFACSNNVSF